MLSGLLGVEVPQFFPNCHEPVDAAYSPFVLGYREDFAKLDNVNLGTGTGSTFDIGVYEWTLRNFNLGPGWLTSLELDNDGLTFTFNNQVSSFGTVNDAMPYIYINPATLVPELATLSAGKPVIFVMTVTENGDANDELCGLMCLDGTGPTGDSLGLFCGYTRGAEGTKWFRDAGGVLTSSDNANSDNALLMETIGGRAKCFWGSKIGIYPPSVKDPSAWTQKTTTGSTFNKGAGGAEGFADRRLCLGGFTGNNNANFVFSVKMLEVWYIPNYEVY